MPRPLAPEQTDPTRRTELPAEVPTEVPTSPAGDAASEAPGRGRLQSLASQMTEANETTDEWQRPLRLGFLVIAGFVLTFMLLVYSPLARPLLWAIAFSVLVYPAHLRLVRLFGGRATLAAVCSTVLWCAVVVGPSFLALGQLLGETRDLWSRVSAFFGEHMFENVAVWVERSPLRRFVYLLLEVPESSGAQELEAHFKTTVDAFASFLMRQLRNLTLSAPNAVFDMSITIVTFGFLLRQGPELASAFKAALPIERVRADALLRTLGSSIHAVFRGVLLTAAAQGSLAMLGYSVVGAPVPVLLGFLTFIGSLIPFVGAVAIWLPTAFGLYIAGLTTQAVGLALWGACVVSLVDNFLRPYFIRRGVKLPMLWLFLALIGGLQVFGLLGLLLGPASLALYVACYRIYMQDLKRRSQATTT